METLLRIEKHCGIADLGMSGWAGPENTCLNRDTYAWPNNTSSKQYVCISCFLLTYKIDLFFDQECNK